ncbi:DENN domain protein (macronuclear) [Tetrahymena thermophila SB210]|uniref:DENN domain protein n=1 Tax=Tetrahymena thermophila (strain SB210) TaxID=312017 RepID=I7M6S9_TETTS|nr:DENN domain protein [Tetrahymena thermophila SB210]EAR86055.1 DENN domain protein [Tetrahymena thermophila SB210]|eukprot:XP_976650.1 DENN domain protein [Tetrahymena thermophila SB210]
MQQSLGLELQLQQVKTENNLNSQATFGEQDRGQLTLTTMDSSTNITNSISLQREYSSVKRQNNQIKQQNEQLLNEVNELKIKLQLYEQKFKEQEEKIKQLNQKNNNNDQQQDIIYYEEHDKSKLIKKIFQTQKPLTKQQRARIRQMNQNANQKVQDEKSQKFNVPQRFATAENKFSQKGDQNAVSPFCRAQYKEPFDQVFENQNNNQITDQNQQTRQREASDISLAKRELFRRNTQEEKHENKMTTDAHHYHQSGFIKLQKVREESNQLKVEKAEQVVAIGYDPQSNFKTKTQMAMLNDKSQRRIQNNSSFDANFIKKEQKIIHYKNNFEQQKIFSQNLYGKNIQTPHEHSDFFYHQKDFNQGNQGQNQAHVIYSDQPSQNTINSQNNNQNSKENFNPNHTSSIITPQNASADNNQSSGSNSNGNIINNNTNNNINSNNNNNNFNFNSNNNNNNNHWIVQNTNLQNANSQGNISPQNFPKLVLQQSQAPPQQSTPFQLLPLSKQTSLNLVTSPANMMNFNNNPSNNNIQNNIFLNQSIEQNPFSSNDIDISMSNSQDSNLKTMIVTTEQDPEQIKYEADYNKFQKLFFDLKQFGVQGDFLFEEFMIIGPDLNELKDQIEENLNPFSGIRGSTSEYKKGTVKQQILFSQPCYVSPLICPKRQAVSQFAFPQGLQYYRYRSQADLQNMPHRFKDILLMNLCQQKETGISENMFILSIRGEDELRTKHISLEAINSNSIMYAICYQQDDLLVVNDDETGEKTVFLFPTVYCILTYYPFIDFFLRVIQEVVNRIKTIRLVKSSFSGIIDNSLQNVDIDQVIKNLQKDKDLSYCLRALQIREVQPDKFVYFYLYNPQIQCQHQDEKNQQDEKKRLSTFNNQSLQNKQFTAASYNVPPLEEMSYVEGVEAAYLTFSNLPYYDFQLIFTLILLEKKVVFLSKNITLLTLTSITFQNIIKPMKYPHPVIFSICEDLMYFLESPVPIIVGVNMSSEKFEYQYGYNEDCYYIDLDKNMIITKNQQSVCKMESQKFKFGNQKKKIKQIFSEINNNITSKQLGNKFKKFLQRSHNDKRLVYKPDENQIQNLKNLLVLIRKSISETIIEKLPTTPIFQQDNSQQLDMVQIQNSILKNCQGNKVFLENFVETQIFFFYIEQKYF